MLPRSHAILAATSAGLTPSLVVSAAISNTSCHTSKRRNACYERCCRRGYATPAGSQDHSNDADHRTAWPETPKGHACPTPYQIFDMAKNGNYSKNRFYSLVKLYHPDRGCLEPENSSIPHHVRLERYRLIVAAHKILSDPSKRSAYDRFGMGWQGRPELKNNYHSTRGATRPFDHNWQDDGEPIWANATWEDWERFYARREARESGRPEAQQPVYMSNITFLGLIMVVICSGSAINFNRAQDSGQYFVDQRDIVHDRAAKELRRVKAEKQTMGSRDDRLEWFMRQRDATLGAAGSDVEILRQELADRVLPNRDICRSDEVIHQPQDKGG